MSDNERRGECCVSSVRSKDILECVENSCITDRAAALSSLNKDRTNHTIETISFLNFCHLNRIAMYGAINIL